MGERLTWEEIKEKYPDKWVGLSQVEWEDHAPNVKSGIVEYVGDSDDEPLSRQWAGEDIFTLYTTPNNVELCPLGFVGMFGV